MSVSVEVEGLIRNLRGKGLLNQKESFTEENMKSLMSGESISVHMFIRSLDGKTGLIGDSDYKIFLNDMYVNVTDWVRHITR